MAAQETFESFKGTERHVCSMCWVWGCLLLAAAVVAVVDAATEGNTTRADYFCLPAEERVREKGQGARGEVVEQGVLGSGACCLCQEGSAAWVCVGAGCVWVC